MHLVPGRRLQRSLQRAARLRRAARARRRQGRRRLRRQLPRGLPSEMGLLNLFDPATGRPVAIVDAAGLTDMRTGAVTAIGAKHLARKRQPGARPRRRARHGLLERAPARPPVRLRRDPRPFAPAGEPRRRSPPRLPRDLGKPVVATADWESCVRGADIVVEASRLERRSRCSKTEWIKRGAFVVPYGTMSAVELSLTDIMDKLVVDDWGQCKAGPVRQPARACRRRQAVGERRCTPSWARSSPAASRAASATTRPSCSGIAACRCRTSRWATRCCTRRGGWASASGFAMRDLRSERELIARAKTTRDADRGDESDFAMLIANARMYAVNAAVAAAWRTLLEWVIARAGVDCEVIDYPAPAAAAGTVGAPGPRLRLHVRLSARARAAAAARARRAGARVRRVWRRACLLHRHRRARRLADRARSHDTFGRRFAFTTDDSQSGYQAPRALAGAPTRAHGGALFAATVGPLVTPRRVVDAVLAGDADAGPLDSYVARSAAPPRARACAPLRVHRLDAADAASRRWWRRSDVPRRRRANACRRLLPVAAAEDWRDPRARLLLRRIRRDRRRNYARVARDARDADTAATRASP